MASLVKSRSGKSHYVLLKDKYDVQAAEAAGLYVKRDNIYNGACPAGDVVGPYGSREEAAAVQGPINDAAQKLRPANVDED